MPRLSFPLALAISAGLLLGGPANPVLAAPVVSAHADKQYIIRYGDSINVYVVENDKLSISNQPIRPDGRVSLPLVGEVMAGGLTLPQLTERVAKSYTKFFVDPHVVVNIATFRPLSINVIGKVLRPGAIAIREPVRILNALALAGGLDLDRSDLHTVLLLRANGDRLTIDVEKILNGTRAEDNVFVDDGDTIRVEDTFYIDWWRVAPFLNATLSLISTIAVIFFGTRIR